MPDIQYKESKKITCHLTQIKLVKCPISTCMWSDQVGGCNFTPNTTPEILGTTLLMSDKQIKTHVRRGRVDINRYIVLDSYVAFIKKRVVSMGVFRDRLVNDAVLNSLLRSSKIYNVLTEFFGLDNYLIVSMLKSRLYKEYIKSVGAIAFTARGLLGIRKQYVEKIRVRVKDLTPKTVRRVKGTRPTLIKNKP